MKRNGMQRIYDGIIAAYPIPWQAVLFKKSRLICGGIIIDQTTILTAAHCFARITAGNRTHYGWTYDLKLDWYKVAWEAKFRKVPHDEQFQPERIIVHPDFNRLNFKEGNDIAIMKLPWKYRITYGTYIHSIAPICLPTPNFQDVMEDCDLIEPESPQCSRYMNMSCYISGFGLIEACNVFIESVQKMHIVLFQHLTLRKINWLHLTM